MIQVWDYFMRRKGLLLSIIAAFWISSTLSYHALISNASEREIPYINIDSWGEEIEVPRTGGEDELVVLAILDANSVVKLEETEGAPGNVTNDDEKSGEILNATGRQSGLDNSNMSDEVLEDAVKNLHETKRVQTGYIELESSDTPKLDERNLSEDIKLILMSAAVLTLGIYFTYQHFMR